MILGAGVIEPGIIGLGIARRRTPRLLPRRWISGPLASSGRCAIPSPVNTLGWVARLPGSLAQMVQGGIRRQLRGFNGGRGRGSRWCRGAIFPALARRKGHAASDARARGGFVGLSLGHAKGHLVRAVLEGSSLTCGIRSTALPKSACPSTSCGSARAARTRGMAANPGRYFGARRGADRHRRSVGGGVRRCWRASAADSMRILPPLVSARSSWPRRCVATGSGSHSTGGLSSAIGRFIRRCGTGMGDSDLAVTPRLGCRKLERKVVSHDYAN